MTLVARHRAIYQALGDAMGSAVHALAIAALAPSEWRSPADPGQRTGG
jgi:stress-induced morphogen